MKKALSLLLLIGLLSVFRLKRPFWFLFHSVGIWASYYLHFYLTFYCFDFTENLGPMAALVAFVVGTFAVCLVQIARVERHLVIRKLGDVFVAGIWRCLYLYFFVVVHACINSCAFIHLFLVQKSRISLRLLDFITTKVRIVCLIVVQSIKKQC